MGEGEKYLQTVNSKHISFILCLGGVLYSTVPICYPDCTADM